MQQILLLVATGLFFVALLTFFHSLNNAFKKSFYWGMIFLLFPIGSYLYYKKYISEEKIEAILISVGVVVGGIIFGIAKLL